MPQTPISWIGAGRAELAGITSLGYQDFKSDSALRLIASHDFLLTVGTGDANPCTNSSGNGLGLVPVCTPSSGYVAYPGIMNIPVIIRGRP